MDSLSATATTTTNGRPASASPPSGPASATASEARSHRPASYSAPRTGSHSSDAESFGEWKSNPLYDTTEETKPQSEAEWKSNPIYNMYQEVSDRRSSPMRNQSSPARRSSPSSRSSPSVKTSPSPQRDLKGANVGASSSADSTPSVSSYAKESSTSSSATRTFTSKFRSPVIHAEEYSSLGGTYVSRPKVRKCLDATTARYTSSHVSPAARHTSSHVSSTARPASSYVSSSRPSSSYVTRSRPLSHVTVTPARVRVSTGSSYLDLASSPRQRSGGSHRTSYLSSSPRYRSSVHVSTTVY